MFQGDSDDIPAYRKQLFRSVNRVFPITCNALSAMDGCTDRGGDDHINSIEINDGTVDVLQWVCNLLMIAPQQSIRARRDA